MNEAIAAILQHHGIDPDQQVYTDTGLRTAFQVLEGAVVGALDQIDENKVD
jgi:hypothetical protein